MNRDVWAERRELLEYVLKEHARRGGRVIAAPQTALYDHKILDHVNTAALVRQLQNGSSVVELARVLLPASSTANGSTAVNGSNGRSSGTGDNPFGPPLSQPPGNGLSASGSAKSSFGMGTDNPFGAPAAAAASFNAHRVSGGHHVAASADNPFALGDSSSGGAAGGGGSGGGGAGGYNPFSPSGKPPTGHGSADGGGVGRSRPRLNSNGNSEPPVTVLSTAVKLTYGTGGPPPPTASASPLRGGGGGPDAARSMRRGAGGYEHDSEEGLAGGLGGALRPPRLELPQLETGQTDDQLRDLAYLLFAACAAGSGIPQHGSLLLVMRQQLGIEEARAADVARVLRHLQPAGDPTLIDQPHPTLTAPPPGAWRPAQRASLELLLRLIAVVRPSDFEAPSAARAFAGFLRWKDVTVAVLERQLAAAVGGGGWVGEPGQLRRLLARMHGAARRADVRGQDDYEEGEYGEATAVLAETAGQLAAGCATGLRFPWAVRVRVVEILITALFDTVEEGTYIDEAALVQQFLDTCLFPAMGVSGPTALAVNAWVHFSMYVGTGCREQRLLKQLKQHISRLAASAAEAAGKTGDTFGLGPAAEPTASPSPPPPSDELARDTALCGQVAGHIVDYVYTRLTDYHVAFPKGENMAAMLDVFVFACRSRGDSSERLSGLLVEAVATSTAGYFGALMRVRCDAGGAGETRLLELASVVHDIHDADVASYCAALAPHLPTALGLAAVRLHQLYGRELVPWLGIAKSITPAVLDVFRTVNALEQRLAGPVGRAAGSGPHPPAVGALLGAFERWDLNGPLKAAMMQWVSSQIANMATWTARALQSDTWRTVGGGPDGSHTSSASEVSRMTHEALDALYGMDVPMPPEVPAALMEGVDAVLRKYVTYVNDKLGALQRLVPPLPPMIRYKKDLVVKNEQVEKDAGRSTHRSKTNPRLAFMASVPPVESSPEFTNLTASLTPEVLAAAACSLHFLHNRAGALLQTYRERQLQSAALHPPSVPAPGPTPAPGSLGGAPGSTTAKSLPLGEQQSQKSDGGASTASSSDPPELLTTARTALVTGMQYACKFLATRVIYWDQRSSWLEFLYRHHATTPAARIDPLLEALNGVLAAVCPGLPQVVRTAFARHLLVLSVQALERVLLDGGPCRWFIPSDVQVIDLDIHKLRALFHADGDGLDRELIDGELERVRRLLPLMKQEVGPLMDLLKSARTHGTAQLTPTDGPPAVYDESTIMKVLAHRPERNGSKLLKTLYKLPKKLK